MAPTTPTKPAERSTPVRPASPPADEADKLAYCFETGTRFRAPATRNTLALLARFWQPGSFVTLLLGFSLVWVGLPAPACDALGIAGLPYAGAATDWQLLLVATFWRVLVVPVCVAARVDARD